MMLAICSGLSIQIALERRSVLYYPDAGQQEPKQSDNRSDNIPLTPEAFAGWDTERKATYCAEETPDKSPRRWIQDFFCASKRTDEQSVSSAVTVANLTYALVGVGVVQIVVYWIQARIMGRQLRVTADSVRVAENTLRIAQRAWMQIEAVALGPLTYNVNGMNIGLMFTLKNTGQSPALHTRVNMLAYLRIQSRHNPQVEQQKFAMANTGATKHGMGNIVFPNAPIRRHIGTTIPFDEIEGARTDFLGLRDDHVQVFVVGSVTYRLAFIDEVHQTGFIYNISVRDRHGVPGLLVNVEDGDIPADKLALQEWHTGAYTD